MFVRTLTGKGKGRSGCGRLAIGKMYKHLLFRFAFLEGGWEIMHVAFFFAIVCFKSLSFGRFSDTKIKQLIFLLNKMKHVCNLFF